MGEYDSRKSLEKAGWDLVNSLVGVVAFAAMTYLSDPAHLAALVQAAPPSWAVVAGLGASALAAFARNWLKHR